MSEREIKITLTDDEANWLVTFLDNLAPVFAGHPAQVKLSAIVSNAFDVAYAENPQTD